MFRCFFDYNDYVDKGALGRGNFMGFNFWATAQVATSDSCTTPAAFNYWPGSEPRAAQINAIIRFSAGVRFTDSNKTLMAFCDSSFIPSDDSGTVDPAYDVTAIFRVCP